MLTPRFSRRSNSRACRCSPVRLPRTWLTRRIYVLTDVAGEHYWLEDGWFAPVDFGICRDFLKKATGSGRHPTKSRVALELMPLPVGSLTKSLIDANSPVACFRTRAEARLMFARTTEKRLLPACAAIGGISRERTSLWRLFASGGVANPNLAPVRRS